MLGSFRTRMLLVIVIVVLSGLSLQSGHDSSRYLEPVISNYVLSNDSGWTQKAADWWNIGYGDGWALPVESPGQLTRPCEYISVLHFYGWSWDAGENRQVFDSKVVLEVAPDTVISPVLPGKIIEIEPEGSKFSVLVEHSGNMFSYYGELEEVRAELNQEIQNQPLGKASGRFEFQLLDQDGPVDPNKIFE